MLHQLLTTDYLFWLVAFLFYLLENIKLTKQNELILQESAACRFNPLVSLNGFEIGVKEVHVLKIFTPYTTFIKLNIDPKRKSEEGFIRESRLIGLFEFHLLPFRVIGSIAFIYLLAGPILTFYFGIAATFIFLTPIHLLFLLLALFFLVLKRKQLGLSCSDIGAIYFELLLVPAYMAAITKKIGNKKKFLCDGFYFSLRKTVDLEVCSYLLARKIEALASLYEESDARFMAYRDYKLNLGLNDVKE